MRYARYKEEDDSKYRAYRIYVTDALKVVAENTAKFVGGASPKRRYADLFMKPVQEERSADEIINSIKAKLEG